ncbi:MAG TPA: hypothetical protein VMS16_05295 [Mycobacterium sp.]|nr:hypothetical protein [Mycobacterium sp.]
MEFGALPAEISFAEVFRSTADIDISDILDQMSTWQPRRTAPPSSVPLIDVPDLPMSPQNFESNTPPQCLSDLEVVLLRPEHGPPAAVVKVARSRPCASELRRQRQILAELAIHPELDEEWRELLPRTLAFDERAGATVSVESYRPGIGLAELLARRPDRVEELTAAALSAITSLHRRTATFVVVDNICFLRRWVVEPLSALDHMCRRLAPRLIPDVAWLGILLRRALVGRRLPMSWTHGEYTPGNVRVAGVQGPVTGILNWGGARPGRPALIDEYLMVLTATSQVERSGLGAVITERLQAGALSDRERNALLTAHDHYEVESSEGDRISERVAILLTWLHHAADMWRKRAALPDHHTWWNTNVAPVLDAVAAGHEYWVARAQSTPSGAPMIPSSSDSPAAPAPGK